MKKHKRTWTVYDPYTHCFVSHFLANPRTVKLCREAGYIVTLN